MKRFIETLKNIWKIEELKSKILLTLGLLLIYRVGSNVVLPGIDPESLEALRKSNQQRFARYSKRLHWRSLRQCLHPGLGYYALYLGIHCHAVAGYGCPQHTENAKGG